MIVRISGVGQYELDETGVRQLDGLDTKLTAALNSNNEVDFYAILRETIGYIKDHGTEVGSDTVVPSDVIVPPDDISLDEAKQFFTDEGLMNPIPA